ncbi:alanine--tRNA ligase [Buchnera aphidicola (Ceratovacuna keduensis)]|uniref:alanine--tRNA ligase n=1 Tax=Buchnera aphidicola TaxID=9 RepID=UPI0031B80282
MKIKSYKIKKMFLNFFKKRGHKILKGGPIIPKKDKTLLFTNAGMNQFKEYFLGKKNIKYNKIVTSQKCIRTGGKHNDIKQVGITSCHHTLFEMLGNFSFGSYSKKKAILYAWKLLTNKKYFNLKKKKLFVTVNYEDLETYNIWLNIIKISKKNIKISKKNSFENFWEMGKTGPCGPSTEIFYKKCYIKNKKKIKYFVEIWNIVFIQYNKIKKNKFIKLNNLYIDTGMGLERIAHILQNKKSTYEIDIFKNIRKKIIKISKSKKIYEKSVNIILDHIRTVYFIMLEGIMPSNKHQGYILRKIIRRIIIHGNNLNIKTPFLYILIKKVLKKNKNKIYNKKIKQILKNEEKNFKNTIKTGFLYLKKRILEKNINEKTVFYLYDTLGLPINITIYECKKHNIKINKKKILKIIEKQKKINKKNNKFKEKYKNYILNLNKTKFLGYKLKKINSKIIDIYINEERKNIIRKKEKGEIILKKTTFFGKSSGQIGDSGKIYNKNSTFIVKNTKKINNTIVHIGKVIKGNFSIQDKVKTKIDYKKRLNIQSNHTSTHLLHKTLKKILGKKIHQEGSNIKKKYFTFDFSYNKKILEEEIYKIEKIINKEIQKNNAIKIKIVSLEKYKKIYKKNKLEKKKYENVRIVKIGNFSLEPCSGTHVKNTGEIGIFKIFKIYKISNKNYRIKALTKNYALKEICKNEKIINNISVKKKIKKENILKYINSINEKNKLLEKKMFLLEEKLLNKKIKKTLKNILKINKYSIVIKFLYNQNNILIRKFIDNLEKINNKIITIIANIKNKNISIIVKISKNISKKINAKKILKIINLKTNGTGGGKIKLAQGGNKNINLTKKILKNINVWFPYK